MKKIYAILLIGFFTMTLSAQEKMAKIEFETTVIDYGTIEKGANGIRVFKFKNTGNAPLVVSAVKSSCGCTVPKKPEAPILPGEDGEIQVKYDTKRVNPIRKTITVTSNADTPTADVPMFIVASAPDNKPDIAVIFDRFVAISAV